MFEIHLGSVRHTHHCVLVRGKSLVVSKIQSVGFSLGNQLNELLRRHRTTEQIPLSLLASGIA